jgi:hypothetical protein
VATFVSLDAHAATSVMMMEPLQVSALAVKGTVLPAVVLGLVGDTVIELMQPAVTVRVVEPVMAMFLVEVAVTVIVPMVFAAAVTSPLAEMVAALAPPDPAGAIVQVTGVLPVLPSLKVALAVICTVLLVVPV